MVAALDQESSDRLPKRPLVLDAMFLSDSKGLEQLVTKNTRRFFSKLKLQDGFLLHHPSSWTSNSEYVQARVVVSKLAVMNDRAERAVVLVKDLNGKLTGKEEQLQFLVQVVNDHRKQYPASNKSALLKTRKN